MKTPEFVVDIEPGRTSDLRVSVHACDLAPIEDEVERPLPSLMPADLDELRSGAGSERMTEAIATQVTGWLLQNDLRGHLGTALHAATSPFRILIRPHPKVLCELADVPFELLKVDADPLALQPSVRAIVHTLKQRRRDAPAPTVRKAWPFRVLLVRTNPGDLGGLVPPALPIRDHILEIARASGLADVVEVTVLSSEEGGAPVTYDALRAELRATSYSLLVYLGHGDLQDAGFEGLPPIGVLLFEIAGSPFANPIRSDQLRSELQNRPVPVVVLVGCLTAASDAVRERLPQWMRGSQSVAQSLIHGESGVQCAIGMRHRLETADAEHFLQAFIRSLLKEQPGDVERAVRAGREEMFAQKPYPPSWSAPVLFSVGTAEPIFDFMCAAVSPADPLDEHDQDLRRTTWKALSELPGTLPLETRRFPTMLLDTVESGFLERRKRMGVSVIWPTRIEAEPGAVVRVAVQHAGFLSVSRLEGRLAFPEPITALSARPGSAISAAGLRVFFALHQPGEVRWFVEPASRSRPGTLAPGTLFEVDLPLPDRSPVVYDIRIDALLSEPKLPLCGWNNAIVVPPR